MGGRGLCHEGSSMSKTLYLTNWSLPRFQGPGRKWTAMSKPRRWEKGEGRVFRLTPERKALELVKRGTYSFEDYFRKFSLKLAQSMRTGDLVPGSLLAALWDSEDYIEVDSGDSILCCCSQKNAEENNCHLSYALPALVYSGWNVNFHGKLYSRQFPFANCVDAELGDDGLVLSLVGKH